MNNNQAIPLKSIQNARELGGYRTMDGRTVRRGLLLRTGKLNEISAEDIRLLQDEYRLQTVVDFRMAMELPAAPDPEIGGAEYRHLDVIDMAQFLSAGMPEGLDFAAMDKLQMTRITIESGLQNDMMYIGFLSADSGKKAFSDFFRILLAADPDRAVLWHCTSGKDRTGLAAMLLLSALGADEELIMKDYLLTNEFNAAAIAEAKRSLKALDYPDDFISRAVLVFSAVDESYLRNGMAYLKENYGSPAGYIRDALNISQTEIDSLKEKYLF